MNKFIASGRLTADPELKQTQNGIAVCSFSLAVKRPHKKDEIDFVNFVAWRQTAEYLCRYAKKGSMIEASGSLQSRKHEGKVYWEIQVDDLSIIYTAESKEASGGDQVPTYNHYSSQSENFEATDTSDENLPF